LHVLHQQPQAAHSLFRTQVDIVVTVSGFSAVPSLSTGIASRFGMRSDVECFSLSGHGCPGGLVGVGCVEQLLLVRGLRGVSADVRAGARPCGCLSRTRVCPWSGAVRRASSHDMIMMMIAVSLLQAKTRGGRLALLVINENTTTGALLPGQATAARPRGGGLHEPAARALHPRPAAAGYRCGTVGAAQAERCCKPTHRAPHRPTPHMSAAAGFYTGNEEAFLLSNVLFRMGGAACLMSTRCALEPHPAGSGRPCACTRRLL